MQFLPQKKGRNPKVIYSFFPFFFFGRSNLVLPREPETGVAMGERQTYRAIVEVEEGRAEELSPLPEDLVGAGPVVRRRRVVEGRHLGDGGAILWRGRGDGGRGRGRGEAGVGPGGGGGERGLEEPPGGGEALHLRRCGFLPAAARVVGGLPERRWTLAEAVASGDAAYK